MIYVNHPLFASITTVLRPTRAAQHEACMMDEPYGASEAGWVMHMAQF